MIVCEFPKDRTKYVALPEILNQPYFHSSLSVSTLYTWPKNEYSTLAGYLYGGKPNDGNWHRTRGKPIHGIQRIQVRATQRTHHHPGRCRAQNHHSDPFEPAC